MKAKALRNRTNHRHDGKKAYDDEWDAKTAAAMANLRYGGRSVQVPYLCGCGKYHVGSSRSGEPY